MKTPTLVNFWLDLLLLLVMTGLAATGGLIHFLFPPGMGCSRLLFGLGRHDFGQIHFYLAAIAVLLLTMHVLMHCRWICSVVSKAFGSTTSPPHRQFG
jgi:hypothetical protein